jgi:hypothetical protein
MTDPWTLCQSLLTQYYDGLLTSPINLATCYGKDSELTLEYNDPDEAGRSIRSKGEQIATTLMSLSSELTQCQVEVLTANGYPSFNDCVLILVTGALHFGKYNQRFNNTFIIRPNGTEGEFYIRNDIWQLFEREVIPEPPAAHEVEEVVEEVQHVPVKVEESPSRNRKEEVHQPVSSPPKVSPRREAVHHRHEEHSQPKHVEPVPEVREDSPARDDGAIAQPEMEELRVDDVHEVPEPKQETPPVSPPKTAAKQNGTTEPAKEKSAAPAKPTSWASVASTLKTAPIQTEVKPQRVSPPPQAQPQATAPAKEKAPAKDAKPAVSKQSREPKSKVAMKSPSADPITQEEVEAVLPPSLANTIVSYRNHQGKYFTAFLDFSVEGALDILSKSPLVIKGKTMMFEPQRERDPKK